MTRIAYENRSTVPEPGQGTSGAVHVRGLGELAYAIVTGEMQDQIQSGINKTTVLPGGDGALYVAIEYMGLTAPVGKRLFVAFNAENDTEANGMLGSPGQRYVIPINGWREWGFEPGAPLTRIDFCSDASSESNGSLVTWEYGLL